MPKKQKKEKKLLKQLQRGSIGSFFVFGMVAFLIVAGMVAVGGIPTRLPSQMGDQILPITPTPGGQHSDETQQMETFGFITLTPTPTPTPTIPVPGNSGGGSGGGLSGLPWNSGVATGDFPAFAAWRGRPVDVMITWNDDSSTLSTAHYFVGWNGKASAAIRLFQGGGACHDTPHFTSLAKSISDMGFPDAYIRLGWEFNGDWFDFNTAIGRAPTWIACYRKAAFAFKAVSPQFLLVVDIVGVDYYNDSDTSANFQAACNAGSPTKPQGLCQWLAFAKAHGKKLSLPEWGINRGLGGGDDPSYIQSMHTFLMQNQQDIAYEAYFNLDGDRFQIYPTNLNPNGAAKYKELWGK
jgi:hypothetical protein